MALHFFSTSRLARKLAAGQVPAEDQAIYLAISFVVWLVPAYLYIMPNMVSSDPLWVNTLWFGQFALLVAANWGGVLHCFRQCHHQPERHFMIDFACLYAPASIAVLVATWAAFYVFVWSYYWLAVGSRSDLLAEQYAKFHDVLNYVVIVGQVALIYFLVGRGVRRAADLRAAGA